MKLVNETGQRVAYWISSSSNSECGEIDIGGLVDHPSFDNQTNVYVAFNTSGGTSGFTILCDETGTGEQVEMALLTD